MDDKPTTPSDIQPVEWETESFQTHQRGWSWYLIVGIILLAILVFTIYTRRWVLAAVTVMIGVVFYLSGRLKSEKIKCRIDVSGVMVGERLFPYEQLKTFWITRSPKQQPKLNLIATARLMPVISLALPVDLVDRVRQALGGKLPESSRQGEDWIDRINRWLRL